MRRGDDATLVHPVSRIREFPREQDGGTVFAGDADDFGTSAMGEFELIADRGRAQPSRRCSGSPEAERPRMP